MSRTAKQLRNAAWIVGAGLIMAGCSVSRLNIGDEFGYAVRQDQVAQVADPEAQYKGSPPAGSNGARVGIAQARYEANNVIRPASMETSSVSSSGGGGGGGGGGS